jgi:hypothetical protein
VRVLPQPAVMNGWSNGGVGSGDANNISNKMHNHVQKISE